MDDQDKRKFFERKPNFDFSAKLSRDGRFFIFKETQTWVIPRKYLDVITANRGLPAAPALLPVLESKPAKKGKRNANSDE